MNITIIGASAGLGLETLKRALQSNHQVTTLSRSEIKLESNPTFISIQGSATNKQDVLKAIENAEAVIVCLGTRKNMKPTSLFSDFAKVLVEIRETKKLDIPFIIVTGFGAGESKNYVSWFVKIFLKYFLKDVYADKTKMEEIISESSIPWIIVRPGRLLDAPMTGSYRVEKRLYKGIKIGGINRADVADFMVRQAEKPNMLGEFVSISEK